MRYLRARFSIAAALFAFVCVETSSREARASCGLDYCPLPQKASSPNVNLQILGRYAQFDLNAGAGDYYETNVRAEFFAFSSWSIGGWVSPIILNVDGADLRTGIANPVLFVQRRFRVSDDLTLAAAFQFETPLGNSDAGLASDHFEILPYLSASKRGERYQFFAQIGLAAAMGGQHSHDHAGDDHDHGHDELFFNPHSDDEALFRVALMRNFGADHGLSAGLHVNGRVALKGDEVDDMISVAGVGAYRLGPVLQLILQVERPVALGERFDLRLAAGIQAQI